MFDIWVFGYGSLVWRPSIPFVERAGGRIRGFVRRFYQGSTDHRGVPGRPGRVVTLLDDAAGTVDGMAYSLPPDREGEILRSLDHREKGGYERRDVEVTLRDGRQILALVYIATPANRAYLGPAPIDAIAEQVLRSEGPSGKNFEYVVELASALRSMDADDPHVFELEAAVRRLAPNAGERE